MSKNTQYAQQYAELAMEQMREYGIPASVILAQGILESSSGQSRLALDDNNHFGIKATKQWIGQGGRYALYTDDRPNERFCSYDSVRDSYEHHSKILADSTRYAGCFLLSPDDYKGWTEGLAEAGYASDGDYARKLQEIIESNGLQKYDQMVMAETNSRDMDTVQEQHAEEERTDTESVSTGSETESPEDWMKKLLSSEDGSLAMSGTNDPIVDMMVKAFTSLMMLAAAIDGRSDEEQKDNITEMASERKVDLTSLMPQMKSCALVLDESDRAVLQADNGTVQISRELTVGELGRLSTILNNPDISDEGKQMRVAGMVNSIILSEQASRNFELGMSEQQSLTEQIRR